MCKKKSPAVVVGLFGVFFIVYFIIFRVLLVVCIR